MTGLLIVDKPQGPTSHDVVARVRRLTGERRVGHAGTLDPMATGVLVLLLGRATRLARFVTGRRKRYDAVIRLGRRTDTNDAWGATIDDAQPAAVESLPDREAVVTAADRFRGALDQTPPAYSAKKVGGVASYELARRDRPTPLMAAQVEVDELVVHEVSGDTVQLSVTCSAGFYVRALARDLGDALGCGGHLAALRRTASGDFTIEHAVSLDALDRTPGLAAERLLPMESAVRWLPAVCLTAEGAARARHGVKLTPADVAQAPETAEASEHETNIYRVLTPDGQLIAVAEQAPGTALWPLQPTVVVGYD